MTRKLDWDRNRNRVHGPIDSSGEISERDAAEDRAIIEKPQTEVQRKRAEARRASAMLMAKTEADRAKVSRTEY
jgi:hypothetical protein